MGEIVIGDLRIRRDVTGPWFWKFRARTNSLRLLAQKLRKTRSMSEWPDPGGCGPRI